MVSSPRFRPSSSLPGWRSTFTGAALFVLMGAMAPAGQAQPQPSALPAMGDVTSQSLSPMAERRLGDRIMRSVWRDPSVVDDPLVLEHVQNLWQGLLLSARQRGEITEDLDDAFAWTPFLVKDRSVNAFALPGGYIGIHHGLVAVTATPDELASVLAHELSHVTQRHIARLMMQAKQSSWVSLASMILGAVAMSRSPEAGQAIIMGGQGAATQGQLNFSRDMEREADRVGHGILSDAGHNPAGMARMFELLARASRLNDDNSFPYLRTHPLTTERIGEARARLGTSDLSGQGANFHVNEPAQALALRHALMSARSRVLMDTRSSALQEVLNQAQAATRALATSPSAMLSAHYAALVAAVVLKDRASVDLWSNQVRDDLAAWSGTSAQEAGRIWRLTHLEGLLETGRAAQALSGFQARVPGSPASLLPDARPEVVLKARAALNLPDAQFRQPVVADVTAQLQTLLSGRPADLAAWQLLGALWNRQGQPLRAVRAESEAAAMAGDLQGALDRVQSVRRRYPQPTAADLIELQVLEARARVWLQTLKEDAKDAPT
jgi:beta-barrel assembly-enhancing protease